MVERRFIVDVTGFLPPLPKECSCQLRLCEKWSKICGKKAAYYFFETHTLMGYLCKSCGTRFKSTVALHPINKLVKG